MHLKKFFDSVRDFAENSQYGPFYPAPDVKEKLEDLGYKFEPTVIGFYSCAAPAFHVTAPGGEEIGRSFFPGAADKQYYEDYYRIAAECKAAAKPPEPGLA